MICRKMNEATKQLLFDDMSKQWILHWVKLCSLFPFRHFNLSVGELGQAVRKKRR